MNAQNKNSPSVEKLEQVYFVRCANLVKIGYTGNLRQRIKDLKKDVAWCGGSLELLLHFPGDRTMEKSLHEFYRKYRVPLQLWEEWFYIKGALKQFLIERGCSVNARGRLQRQQSTGFVNRTYEPSATHFWIPKEPSRVVLKMLMDKEQMSQPEIGEIIKCSQSNVSHILTGRQSLTADQIDKLSRFFDVPHSMFFGV